MKKQNVLSIIIALIIGAIATLSLVACKPHEHNYGEWICNSADSVYCENREYSRECECGEVEHKNGSQDDHDYEAEIIEPTCVSGGYDLKTCKICAKTETVNSTPKIEHELLYDFDSTSHWSECKNCDYTTETSSHALNDSGLCTVCEQQLTYTEGLEFELSENGDYYVVVAYEGTEQDVVIPSIYNDLPVREIGEYAFAEYTDILSISIPNSVTSIGDYAFAWCEGLEVIMIPDSVTSIGYSAFYGCSSLESIIIPDSVTSIGEEAFALCMDLVEIRVSENHTAYKSIDGNLYTKDGKTLIQYAIGKTDNEFVVPDSVTSIEMRAFAGCSSLESITISEGLTSIGMSAFWMCVSLTSITIPNSVESLGDYAFAACISLTSITIPDSVTSIGNCAFNDCYNLESVTIGNSVTSIGYDAFNDCYNLESITIPDSVTSIGNYAFYGCRSLESITIGSGVTSIGDSAFGYCNSLESITIGNSVTSIGEGAFADCSSLKSVTIPDSVTSIGEGAFADCNSLESITIPDGVTSIGEGAFADCNSLESITIPDGVTSIGYVAFNGCDSLESIYYHGTESEWNDIEVDYYNDYLLAATIYYYSESEPQEEGNYWHYNDNGEVEVW